MRADVVIVGGGAIGVCCAFELARRGASVTLLERENELAAGCSYGNAGLIAPSHSAPISNPAAVRNGLRWMWRRDSPFYLRPRPAVVPWLFRFTRAARHWEEGMEAIRGLSIASLELHAQLGTELGTGFDRAGLLDVYTTPAGLEGGVAEAARSGWRHTVLDGQETLEREPTLAGAVAGAVHWPDEGRVEPKRFVETVGQAAAEAGAEIRTGVEVRSLDELDAETVVVAAGTWSRQLVRLPLEGGKGYHVDFERSDGDPRIPTWLQETWTLATPFADRLRISGTLELSGLDLSISQSRVDAIRRGGERWFRGLAGRPVIETWAGLRPCLPDGLPAIGRLGRAIVATGHAMKGVALAPITGRLVAQLAAGEEPERDLAPFDPERFSRSAWAAGARPRHAARA
ncbi:MAG TPA: FAD-dependent oxidoreductase [Gaiellaceae bacterium]|nr:FAD-dependent oxidoreductase [Gaiellaceae bacterium]